MGVGLLKGGILSVNICFMPKIGYLYRKKRYSYFREIINLNVKGKKNLSEGDLLKDLYDLEESKAFAQGVYRKY